MNIREYVDQAGITAEVVENHGIQRDADGWEHRSATVRLTNAEGYSMVTPWRQGMGITEHPAEQVAEIVDSLISDVWTYQQSSGFEDWADDYGYDTDSRKAEKIYQAIATLESPVVHLLGGQEKFEHVATHIDRL